MLFRPTLKRSEVRPISANLNRPISDLAHNSTIFGQKHNVGCFSLSTFLTQPDSAFGIEKFQEFWNFLESLESLYESLNSGHFGQMGHHFHSILSPGFDSEVRIEKFQRFWHFPIPDSRDSQKIPKLQNLWNFSILTSESNPGPKIEWK